MRLLVDVVGSSAYGSLGATIQLLHGIDIVTSVEQHYLAAEKQRLWRDLEEASHDRAMLHLLSGRVALELSLALSRR